GKALARGLGLGERHALDVPGRRFARAQRLERLGVLVVAGQQQLEAHADLAQQLLAARALRGEVDEGFGHGFTRGDRDGRRGSTTRETTARPAGPAPADAVASGWTSAASRRRPAPARGPGRRARR